MGHRFAGEGRVGRGRTDAVFVDVDGTLLFWQVSGSPTQEEIRNARDSLRGLPHAPGLLPRVNRRLVGEVQRWYVKRLAHGAQPLLVIWSMGGADHAAMARDLCAFPGDMRICCMPKPDMMVDDGAAVLFKKHPVVLPDQFTCPEG